MTSLGSAKEIWSSASLWRDAHHCQAGCSWASDIGMNSSVNFMRALVPPKGHLWGPGPLDPIASASSCLQSHLGS